jgi:hypothetical protein
VRSKVLCLKFGVSMSNCNLRCETLCEVKGLRSKVCSVKG